MGVAVSTAGVFVLVISVPVPLLGPGRGTAHALSPAGVTYYHGDHLGSSVVVTGDVPLPGLLRHAIYRPYGGVVAETAGGPTAPPEQGYTGQRFETAAGLYDYGARWYDPNLGRFLQPDPLVPEPFNPQSLNRYSYVMNDPVNRIDPTGQSSILNESSYSGWRESEFPQPPWERAGSIDLGLSRSDPEYLGLRQQPDPIYLPNRGHGPAANLGSEGAKSSRQAFAPATDLGPGHGLIPSAFNCGGGFCAESSQYSAVYVGGAIVLAARPTWAATEIELNQTLMVVAAAQQVAARKALQAALTAGAAVAAAQTAVVRTAQRGVELARSPATFVAATDVGQNLVAGVEHGERSGPFGGQPVTPTLTGRVAFTIGKGIGTLAALGFFPN